MPLDAAFNHKILFAGDLAPNRGFAADETGIFASHQVLLCAGARRKLSLPVPGVNRMIQQSRRRKRALPAGARTREGLGTRPGFPSLARRRKRALPAEARTREGLGTRPGFP